MIQKKFNKEKIKNKKIRYLFFIIKKLIINNNNIKKIKIIKQIKKFKEFLIKINNILI